MKLAYNSNGWCGYALEHTVGKLAELGYDAIELAPQHDDIAPEDWTSTEATRIKQLVADAGLTISNLHVGAKDLLKRVPPHEPSLISVSPSDRTRRLDINRQAIDFAAELGTNLVCLTSGVIPDRASVADTWSRLVDGLQECLALAEPRGIRLAIEPEPELFIRTCFDFDELHRRLGTPASFGLNLDIGHAHVVYEDIPAIIREFAPLIWHVHVEDISGRVHKHLPPGQGEVNFHAIGKALAATGYSGAASVELMDHRHEAAFQAKHCMSVLRTWRRPARAA